MNIDKVNATLGKAIRNIQERELDDLQNQAIEDNELEEAMEASEEGEED